jgi:predicted DNA-binding ribbon-helix-helix protein
MAGPKKRSIRIAGHRTSLSLEPQFWEALTGAAKARRMSVAGLIQSIDEGRKDSNLSSAVRIFVLNEARQGRLGPKGASD